MLKYVLNSSFQIYFSRRSLDSRIQSNFLNNIATYHPLTMSKLLYLKLHSPDIIIKPATWLDILVSYICSFLFKFKCITNK